MDQVILEGFEFFFVEVFKIWLDGYLQECSGCDVLCSTEARLNDSEEVCFRLCSAVNDSMTAFEECS